MMQQAIQIIRQLKEGNLAQKMAAIKEAGDFVEDRSYFPEAVPLLLKFLNQELHPQLAMEAAWTLWKFKDKRAVPLLLQKAKQGKHIGVREKAIRSLGLLEAKEAIVFFRSLIGSNGHRLPQEQAAAIFALGCFKEKKDLKIFKRSLKHPYPVCRQEALLTLLRFFRENPMAPSFFTKRKILAMTSSWLEKCDEVRAEALSVTTCLDRKKAYRFLVKACLKDPSELVRAKGFVLLKDWIHVETEQLALRGMSDVSWQVRSAACRWLEAAVSQNKVWDREKVTASLEVAHEIFPSHLR